MSVDDAVKEVFNKVLDVKPDEIKPDVTIEDAFGVDSTEMVEISVGLKKALKIPIGDNELKKTHSYSEIIDILRAKGAC